MIYKPNTRVKSVFSLSLLQFFAFYNVLRIIVEHHYHASLSEFNSVFFFQKMRELILTSSLKVRMEAENDMLTKTLG